MVIKNIFTSESVTEGHPDKVCDQISDAILDEYLQQDPDARVAVETLVTTGFVMVAGEITSKVAISKEQHEKTIRDTIRDIGYDSSELKFDSESCEVNIRLHEQSSDISQGVTATNEKEQGAGDQGMMFGYATDETKEMLPLPISLAHKLTKRLSTARRNKEIEWLRPDGKSQVSVQYEDNYPKKIVAIVVSTQHKPNITNEEIREEIIKKIVKPVCGDLWNEDIDIHINPTGRFEIGGPHGDAGLTGRKIIVDTYGGYGRHGGGAFSGKDPSKVDRSACYMCRYIAKNIIAAKLANRCEVQVAYAIGVAKPVSLMVNTFGTGKITDEEIVKLVGKHFDMRPSAIVEQLKLKRPIYKQTASFGHFGREGFEWENTQKADALQSDAGL